MRWPSTRVGFQFATAWDVALRVVIVVSALGMVGAIAAADHAPFPRALAVALAIGAVAAAWFPDSAIPAIEIVAVAWVWLARVDESIGGWTLVAAGCVLIFHAATTLAAFAPLGAPADPQLVVRWARRVGIVAAVTVVVWAVTLAADSITSAGNALLFAAALIAVAILAAAVLLLTHGDDRSDDGDRASLS